MSPRFDDRRATPQPETAREQFANLFFQFNSSGFARRFRQAQELSRDELRERNVGLLVEIMLQLNNRTAVSELLEEMLRNLEGIGAEISELKSQALERIEFLSEGLGPVVDAERLVEEQDPRVMDGVESLRRIQKEWQLCIDDPFADEESILNALRGDPALVRLIAERLLEVEFARPGAAHERYVDWKDTLAVDDMDSGQDTWGEIVRVAADGASSRRENHEIIEQMAHEISEQLGEPSAKSENERDLMVEAAYARSVRRIFGTRESFLSYAKRYFDSIGEEEQQIKSILERSGGPLARLLALTAFGALQIHQSDPLRELYGRYAEKNADLIFN